MHFCLILDNPETPHHPVIGMALQKLSTRHKVRLLDVRTLSGTQAILQEEKHSLADLYLLKSHAPQALEVAHYLEQRGARVINSWSASMACQSRILMGQYLNKAGLPWPQTWNFSRLADVLGRHDLLATLSFPLIIKSHYSYRGDLVEKVQNVKELQALMPLWSQEPVILQEFVAGNGWDIKLWVIDQQAFAVRRRTALERNAVKEDIPLTMEELLNDWKSIALEVGRVFNLRLYGVDLLMTERGPLIVDVNAFPGFRGVQGADDLLVTLVEQAGRER